MAFSINRITLLGNVVKDPELKQTTAGKSILKFSIATNHSVKKGDNQYEDVPTYHNIVVFGKQAEWLAKSIRKGIKIYVDGRLSISDYEDKDGQKKRWVEVFANNVVPFTVPKGQDEAIAEPTNDGLVDGKPAENVNPKDIPF